MRLTVSGAVRDARTPSLPGSSGGVVKRRTEAYGLVAYHTIALGVASRQRLDRPTLRGCASSFASGDHSRAAQETKLPRRLAVRPTTATLRSRSDGREEASTGFAYTTAASAPRALDRRTVYGMVTLRHWWSFTSSTARIRRSHDART